MFIIYYSLCFAIYQQSSRREVWHLCETTSCSQAISYPHCSFVFIPRYVYRYPRDCITKCLARREWIPLYRVGPESISLHREGANPTLESSPLLDTLSNVPRTYFTNSHLRENSSKNQSTSSCVK